MVWRTDDESTSATHWYMRKSTVIMIFAVPLMEAGPGLTEVMKLSECDFMYDIVFKDFLSKVNKKSPKEIWYLSYMIVKYRRQCEVYSGTSSGIKTLKQCSVLGLHAVLVQQIVLIIIVTIYKEWYCATSTLSIVACKPLHTFIFKMIDTINFSICPHVYLQY